jgi:SAM-dependent methyltransferase
MQVAHRPIRVNLAYQISRQLIAARQIRHRVNNVEAVNCNVEAVNWQSYYDWRYRDLKAHFNEYFSIEAIIGKDILDFGCGGGSLSIVLTEAGAKSVHGVDLDERALEKFGERLKHYAGTRKPTFGRSSSGKKIDLPDHSFDCIVCFDVMEHVMDYKDIIFEWYRVLRPGGRVYIWWQPYWHPFGHHAHDWVPIPWAHIFLNGDEFREVCARIVDWPDFQPSVWDRNPDGSRKNRFRGPGTGKSFLNRLRVREFEQVCSDAGFEFARREFHPFSMPQPLKAISTLGTKLPGARDFLSAFAIYDLVASTPND